MAVLHADGFPGTVRSVEERFYAELADRMPGNSSVSMTYMQQLPNVTVSEVRPKSSRLAMLEEAGLLGCLTDTEFTSSNSKEILRKFYSKKTGK